MPAASISVNAVVGSDLDLPINTLAQLSNVNIGGETTYTWSILDQPPGTSDALSSTAIQNPTITPRKEHTYLIRLVVNQGLSDEVSDQVVLVVQDLKTRTRIPAALEEDEAGSSGWAKPTGADDVLGLALARAADPGILVAETGAVLAVGAVVRLPGIATLKSGLPGEETVPTVLAALATTSSEVDQLLGVVLGAVDGGAIGSGTLVNVRLFGLVSDLDLGAPAVGDPVYVSDTGTLSTTAGTVIRRVGEVLVNGAGSTDVMLFTGFNAQLLASAAAYTPTNVVTDRAYDADATSVAELADILGTLIADLQGLGIIA